MLLATPSLYNAYYYYKNLEKSSAEDFLKVLNREPIEPNEIMKEGIQFENRIREASETGKETGDEAVDTFAQIVKNGAWQVSIEKPLDNWLLKGRMDVVFPDCIYDIKWCEYHSEYEFGKYKHSIQHLVYMYCTGIHECTYLIGNKKDPIMIESYNWDSDSLITLRSNLAEMKAYIMGREEFRKPFLDNWTYEPKKDIQKEFHW